MKKLVLAAMLGLMAAGGPAAALPLPDLFPGKPAFGQQQAGEPLMQLAQQSPDAIRIQQLQEEIRQLNGRIEELGYQFLQMEERIRKFQEDNEFRFQELEKGKRSENSTTAGEPAVASSSASAPDAAANPLPDASRPVERIAEPVPPVASGNPPGDVAAAETSLPGIDIGSIITGAGAGDPAGGSVPASAVPVSDAEAYQAGYNHILAGDYRLAEESFNDYIDSFPAGERLADAHFWLGEAQYSQEKFSDAAKTFLNAHQSFGKSAKAPEMLLKLGMSLAALDNVETACATLSEVGKRYPQAPRAVATKVGSERKRLKC